MVSERFVVATDVATLLLFHPDDLGHRADDPIAWYSYGFVYGQESAAGRLMAFGTGHDGAFDVRITTGGLTSEEVMRRCAGWVFPMTVRHGRLLLDNSDALPGIEQMNEPEECDSWFELPNGHYRVTVHPIAPAYEMTELDEDEESEADQDEVEDDLPNYVILFEEVDSLEGISASRTPPTLRRQRDWQPEPEHDPAEVSLYEWPTKPPPHGPFRPLHVPGMTPPLPFQSVRGRLPEADCPDEDDDDDIWLLVPPSGQYTVLLRHDGTSWRRGDDECELSFTGRHVLRVRAIDGNVAAAEAVPVPDDDASQMEVERLRADLLSKAETAGLPLFERDRLRALQHGAQVTGWALQHLDVPGDRLLGCYVSATSKRVREIAEWLAAGAAFRKEED